MGLKGQDIDPAFRLIKKNQDLEHLLVPLEIEQLMGRAERAGLVFHGYGDDFRAQSHRAAQTDDFSHQCRIRPAHFPRRTFHPQIMGHGTQAIDNIDFLIRHAAETHFVEPGEPRRKEEAQQ